MNHFLAITSEGGYFGRLYWGNTNSTGSPGQWGSIHWLSSHPDLPGWAGSIGLVRYLLKPLRP